MQKYKSNANPEINFHTDEMSVIAVFEEEERNHQEELEIQKKIEKEERKKIEKQLAKLEAK